MAERPQPNSPEDDELVMSLRDETLRLPPAEREVWLRNACAGDPQLFQIVWHYVQAQLRMKDFLLKPFDFPPLDEEPSELQPGELLENRFWILKNVGEGGMALVYKAFDDKVDQEGRLPADCLVAIKWPKPGYGKRVPREVLHARRIAHANVYKVFDIYTTSRDGEQIDFIAMEFLDGETLADRLHRGPVEKERALIIAKQLCEGLAEAHRNEVIHGDLKSNNIILTGGPDGAMRAVITDFGLARRPGASQGTEPSEPAGAFDYIAPELWKGEKASAASDVFALGVILHELATGGRPAWPDVPWKQRLLQKPVPVEHSWNFILLACLDPDPAERPTVSTIADWLIRPDPFRWYKRAAVAMIIALAGSARPASVRLAILPLETDPATSALSNGLLEDTSSRLTHVKGGPRRLTVIRPSEATENKVGRPEQACKVLGATLTLTGSLRRANGRAAVHSHLREACSQVQLNEWQAEYEENELRNMPLALAGLVTGTLRLPPLVRGLTVNPAAYPDFAQGASLMLRNTGVDPALTLLERAVAADSNSPLTHAKLAEARLLKYRLTNDIAWLDQAIASLQQAQARNPDVPEVLMVAAMVSEYSGFYEKAKADLQRVLDIEPANGHAWRRLGKVYQASNQFKEAEVALRKAIEVQPGYFKNYQDLCALYYNQASYEDAIRECKEMVRLAPDLSDAHFALAVPYLDWGRYAEGENELRVAIGLQDTSAKAHHALGVALMYEDRNQEAIPCFKRALEIGPATPLLYLNLGVVLRRTALLQEAEEANRKSVSLAETELAKNPLDGTLRARLAYLCARLDQRDRAESEAQQARRLSPGSVNVAWILVCAYEALGETDRALALAETAPDDMLRRINTFPDLKRLQELDAFKKLLIRRHIQ